MCSKRRSSVFALQRSDRQGCLCIGDQGRWPFPGRVSPLHRDVLEGDTLFIGPPRNNFQLFDSSQKALLFAAGIGITPLLAMAQELAFKQRPFDLHYFARSTESAAFQDRLAKWNIADTSTITMGLRLRQPTVRWAMPSKRLIEHPRLLLRADGLYGRRRRSLATMDIPSKYPFGIFLGNPGPPPRQRRVARRSAFVA